MLRIINVLLALVALGLAVACGRQVTPEPSVSGLSGQMALKLTVAGSLSLAPPSTTGYTIVINTSGSGGTPYWQSYKQFNFQAFSYAFAVGATSLGNPQSCVAPQLPSAPALLQYFTVGQAQGLGCITRPIPPNLQWIPNYGGQTNEFEIIFSRSLLTFPPVTGTAAPTGAPTATPTPSGVPTPTASGGSPSPTPVASPTTTAQQTWYINFFTTDQNGQAIDTMGGGGVNATGFNGFAINTATAETVIQQNNDITPPSNANSQIISAEVDNFP